MLQTHFCPRAGRRAAVGNAAGVLSLREGARLTWGWAGCFKEPGSLGAASAAGHSQGLTSGLTKEEKPGRNHHHDGQTNEKSSEGTWGGAAESSALLPRAGGRTPGRHAGKLLMLQPHLGPARSKSKLPCQTLPPFMAPRLLQHLKEVG